MERNCDIKKVRPIALLTIYPLLLRNLDLSETSMLQGTHPPDADKTRQLRRATIFNFSAKQA
jgi:hypothetical protein